MIEQELVHRQVSCAIKEARQAGFRVKKTLTAPPRGPIEGQERVVRVKREGDTLLLTTAFYPAIEKTEP